jgi:hypothetical protein
VLPPEFPRATGLARSVVVGSVHRPRVCPKLLLFYVSSENRMEERNVGPV